MGIGGWGRCRVVSTSGRHSYPGDGRTVWITLRPLNVKESLQNLRLKKGP